MTANPEQFSTGPKMSPELLLHETNYAIEVLEKEYPKANRVKILRALGTARSNAVASADRWQILQQARLVLSDH